MYKNHRVSIQKGEDKLHRLITSIAITVQVSLGREVDKTLLYRK